MSFFIFLYEMSFGAIDDGYHHLLKGDYEIGVLSVLVGALSIIAFTLIICLIGYAIYEVIDTSGGKVRTRGTVVGTRYAAAHTTPILVGKTTTLIYHPSRWYAELRVKGGCEELQISSELFTHLRPGDQMDVMVARGRLSKRQRIISLAAA